MSAEEIKVIYNKPATGTSYYTPVQNPPTGTALKTVDGKPLPLLFTPLKIRGVEFQNRIFVSPMCQYSSPDGHLTDWHLAHLGGLMMRGPSLTMVECTGVTPEGRITPEDSGLWKDSQMESLKKIVEFAHSQSQKIGIQLCHAGRKASTVAPWLHFAAIAYPQVGGWPDNVLGPSDEQHSESLPIPRAMSEKDIQDVITAFCQAAARAVQAGVDVIELHGAHGYLLHNFLSPVSNKRTDKYGGSFENRIRLVLEVVDNVRAVIPDRMPLFVRLSATDLLETTLPDTPSWRLEDTVKLSGILADRGVDFIDISSGGNHPMQKIVGGRNFMHPYATAVKNEVGGRALVGTVGNIRSGQVAEGLLQGGVADVVSIARGFLRRPFLVWDFAEELGVEIKIPGQIAWGLHVKLGTSS